MQCHCLRFFKTYFVLLLSSLSSSSSSSSGPKCFNIEYEKRDRIIFILRILWFFFPNCGIKKTWDAIVPGTLGILTAIKLFSSHKRTKQNKTRQKNQLKIEKINTCIIEYNVEHFRFGIFNFNRKKCDGSIHLE